ncbi:nitrogen fixation protein FixH [Rhodobacterales bacterium HKCCE2091]|nr:nitrogen fixation protein FixH [Rhodobacterales bacterium HKCCE2091]
MKREITGRHVALMFVGGFGIIIAVNVLLAVSAVRTFPGVETASSYIAGQNFDANREAQEALGWDLTATVRDDILHIDFTDRGGNPVTPETIDLRIGRPTTEAQDLEVSLHHSGTGYTAPVELGPGRWRLDVLATAEDGTTFRRMMALHPESTR